MKVKNRVETLFTNGSSGGNHDIPTRMKMVYTLLTPELAAILLEKLHPNQRSSKRHRIAGMAADNEAGRWRETHQPIAIDEDGYTIDGQNRCHACIKSGKAMKVWICYNVPRSAYVVTDTGTARSANDSAKAAGLHVPKSTYIGIARQMMAGLKLAKKPLSTQQVLDLVHSYREGIDFTFAEMKQTHGVTVAGVRAVVARAYYTANRERLAKFCKALSSGFIDAKVSDSAVILLRNWLMEELVRADRKGKRTKTPRAMVYGVTEYALDNFLKCRRVPELLCVETELFPLPDLVRFDSK